MKSDGRKKEWIKGVKEVSEKMRQVKAETIVSGVTLFERGEEW